MISVIVYGRNDSHGYNLHKRAALSLNAMAELLDAPGDEIIFTDYNTPDDFPTFPEAILDTLTPRARRLMRVLRVRPAHHARFAKRTHLHVLEPIARNVALRRANPDNRWVLSTNSDMIFTTPDGRSLSAIVAGLADGFYHLPRFEIPEALWETLDRADPQGTMAQVAAWAKTFHLDHVVTLDLPSVRFDAPGDFQLMLREDLMRIQGFDERMLLGWHVDSNIGQRLSMLRGPTGSLETALSGYHCDHTRQVTPTHRSGAPENDWRVYVATLRDPVAPDQAQIWGLAHEAIEEIPLDRPYAYVAALAGAIGPPMTSRTGIEYAGGSEDRIGYEAAHVLPFLADALASLPRGQVLGWFPSRPDMLAMLARAWRAMGFERPLLVAEDGGWPEPLPEGTQGAPGAAILAQADLFGFDFGYPAAAEDLPAHAMPSMGFAVAGLLRLAELEQERRRAGMPPRRVIAVNAVCNRFEATVHSLVGMARSPINTRIRQGFIIPREAGVQELLPLMIAGAAGQRGPDGIRTVPGMRGHVCFGPYIGMLPGRHVVRMVLRPESASRMVPAPLTIEVATHGVQIAAQRLICPPWGMVATLEFQVPDSGIASALSGVEFRLGTRGLWQGSITSVTLARE